jgi:flagellar protein FlaJ
MRENIFESKKVTTLATPLRPVSTGISVAFPELGWNLKKAGFNVDPILFLSVAMLFGVMGFVFGFGLMSLLILKGTLDLLTGILISVGLGVLAVLYVLLLPSLKISRKRTALDKNLEYMLKDMQIQLTAGIPLFDIFVNVSSGGYGECSIVCSNIVHEVQSGKAIVDVLDEAGMLSPSEYMRRVFWQIVNALKTGSNVGVALKMISSEIREEKENKITSYSQELGLWSLIYMIFVIVLPSMGVTLLLILSSFLGSKTDPGMIQAIFWIILGGVIFFQFIFISIIRNKRPDVG